jgi:hypothetical protein|tara:strand:- start:562 stop:897 length:336 start_codon:yes stop_codon:yes gene_type:complete
MPNKKDDPLGLYSSSESYNVSYELDKETTLGLDFQWWWNMRKYKKKEIPARQFADVRIKERNASNHGWPGDEKTVKYWVELENGWAVGMHEPKRGKAEFPMYEMPKEEVVA